MGSYDAGATVWGWTCMPTPSDPWVRTEFLEREGQLGLRQEGVSAARWIPLKYIVSVDVQATAPRPGTQVYLGLSTGSVVPCVVPSGFVEQLRRRALPHSVTPADSPSGSPTMPSTPPPFRGGVTQPEQEKPYGAAAPGSEHGGEPGFVRMPDGSFVPIDQHAPSTVRRRRKLVPIAAIVSLVLVGSLVAFLLVGRTDKAYIEALADGGFGELFVSDEAAIRHAKLLCSDFDSGDPVEGFSSDKIGVEYYCADYLGSFTVLPTPEEQADEYYNNLQGANLTAQFTDRDAAVSAAQRLCKRLENGDPPEGSEADMIAVSAYCPTFAEQFAVLERQVVTGTFTIYDPDPSTYLPSITDYGSSCEGSGGFSDLGSSTSVVVTNAAGEVVARTTLGPGSGGYVTCEFEFSFELVEGEDAYVLSVGDRGEQEYTWAELTQPGAVELSIGL